MQGLFLWAWEGLKRLMEKGYFTYDKTAEDNRNMMEADSNSVSAFVLDCVKKKENNWVATSDLYEIYSNYCSKKEMPRETQDKFSKTFGNKTPFAIAKRRDNVKDGKTEKNARGWLHITTNTTFLKTITQEKSNTLFNRYDLEKDGIDGIEEEEVKDNSLKFDEKLITHIPCTKSNCSNVECNFDGNGKPYCHNHWEVFAEK